MNSKIEELVISLINLERLFNEFRKLRIRTSKLTLVNLILLGFLMTLLIESDFKKFVVLNALFICSLVYNIVLLFGTSIEINRIKKYKKLAINDIMDSYSEEI